MAALGNRSVSEFLDYLALLVAARRRHAGHPQHDVLTRLIQGEAGHETTTNLIGNALVALQEWADARVDLMPRLVRYQSDPAALETCVDTAVDEFLRFELSNQPGNRRATVACQVDGADLPAGALVTLCIGAANRDPEPFPQADQLDLRRHDNRHLAFGFGIHQCAGLNLARHEGRIAIGRFLTRFPGYRLTAKPLRGGRARFRGFLKAAFST